MSNVKFTFFLKTRKNTINQHPIVLSGNTGETDHPKPEQTDHLKGWRKLPNFAGEDFQFCADFML